MLMVGHCKQFVTVMVKVKYYGHGQLRYKLRAVDGMVDHGHIVIISYITIINHESVAYYPP